MCPRQPIGLKTPRLLQDTRMGLLDRHCIVLTLIGAYQCRATTRCTLVIRATTGSWLYRLVAPVILALLDPDQVIAATS